MIFWTVLGTILKIIGIVLLGILLLLLLFLLVLLFVPVRYRAKVVRDGEKLLVQAQVSYIFHLIRLPVCFEDGKLKIRFSVFGITLYSNDRGKKEKKKKAREKGGGEEAKEEEEVTGNVERRGKQKRKGKGSAEFAKGRIKQVSRLAKEDGETAEAAGEITEEKAGDAMENTPQEPTSDMDMLLGMLAPQEEHMENEPGWNEPPTTDEEIPRGPLKLLWKLWRFIKGLIYKGKLLLEKFSKTIGNIKEKISTVQIKARDIKGKGQLIVEFLRDEENKNGIKYAWKSIFQLLKHVFPYKIKGDIVFATGSPYSMGRVLSALGMLYPLYAKSFQLTADFTADHFLLSGSILVKGRVRFGTVLWIAFKLWRKGKIMHLLSAIKELRQKLTAPAS